MLNAGQLLIIGVTIILGYLLLRNSRRDPKEPPLIHNGIPVLGHIIGMIRFGGDYWGKQAKKYPMYPIMTLDLLFTKFYVISSPELMLAAQRNHKTISFEPFLEMTAKNLASINDPKSLNILREEAAGGHGLGNKILHAMVPALTGKPLDTLNMQMTRLIRPFIDQLGETCTLDLYKWCKEAIVCASTDATYGPLNPYKDPKVVAAWWDFENGIGAMMANILPWLTARKALSGRDKVRDAIFQYFQANGPETGSELARVRLNVAVGGGMTVEETASLEVGILIAFVSNTIPATFWCIFEIYSREALLDKLRDEIKSNALSITEDGTHSIDLAAIRDQCPLLVSTFQEILRARSNASPSRIVTKDTLLADKYLLKAGSVVTMASSPMARRPEVWGESAGTFDEARFLKSDGQSSRNPRRPGGLMTFGVSPTICPGRHFASSEILLLVAMIILRYDITPVGGVWNAPPMEPSLVSITGPIKGEFPINVEDRTEYEDAKWDFHVEGGKGQFSLAI